jgi:nitroreductase
MDTVDAIYGRRAIRSFTDNAIPQEEIGALIEAAIQAPNGMNRQPWSFVVATGRPALARWSALAKAHLLQHAATPLVELREPLTSADFNIFYNAPHLVLICATDSEPMSLKDCCLAAENLMLAAHDRGMGTCWIGLAEAWLSSTDGKVELGVPADHVPIAPIIFGRPASTPPRPHREAAKVSWLEPAHAAAV